MRMDGRTDFDEDRTVAALYVWLLFSAVLRNTRGFVSRLQHLISLLRSLMMIEILQSAEEEHVWFRGYRGRRVSEQSMCKVEKRTGAPWTS